MEYDKSRRHKSSTSKKRPFSNSDDGKRKRPNSRLDDGSMSSQPIETIYRILCPVKKIGSVLGRGGDIISTIRKETKAKIRVADAIPGAEERVIIIFNFQNQSGELYSDEAAKNFSNDSLENLKPHCSAQYALLKIHDRIAADEAHVGMVHEKSEPADDVAARILVPGNQVGCILGKGGTIIQQLRSDTGAGIRVLPSENLPPCALKSDELVQISGTPPLVRRALYEISTRLHQHPRKENPPIEEIIDASTQRRRESPPPLPHGNPMWPHLHGDYPPPMSWFDPYRNGPSQHAPIEAEEFSLRVLCATERIGGVIGKGGANVRQLEQQTGVRIQVEEIEKDAGERVIVVSSKEIPADPTSPTIEALILLHSKISAASEKGHLTTRLLVPSSKVGCILGEGGKVITEMRRRSGAEIRVYSKADKPKYISFTEELVQVAGPPAIARGALTEIASRLRTRTFREGSSADTTPPFAPFRGPPTEFLPSREFPPYGRPANDLPYGRTAVDPPYGRPANNVPYGRPATSPPRDPFPGYPMDYLPKRDYPTGSPPFSNAPPPASYHRHAPPDRLPARELPFSTSPVMDNVSRHSYQGHAPQESYSSRGAQQLGISRAGNANAQQLGLARAGNSSAYDYIELLCSAYGYSKTLQAAGQMHERESYRGLASGSGYSSGSIEVRIPNSALESVIGVGGSNLSEIRQISGARVKLLEARGGSSEHVVEIQGTSDQMKAAQSLLQGFIATNSQTIPSSQSSRSYHYSGWS